MIEKLRRPLYHFDSLALTYTKVNRLKNYLLAAGLTLSSAVFASVVTHYWTKENVIVSLTEYEKVLLVEEVNRFSEERLISKISELNFKYPHIVLAQSILETGHYTSGIFIENHNLFGMKEAKSRLNLAQGTNHNHAAYVGWEDSVLDYALWCGTYANSARSEEDYYQILQSVGYAQNPEYITKLKEIVEKEKLKEKF